MSTITTIAIALGVTLAPAAPWNSPTFALGFPLAQAVPDRVPDRPAPGAAPPKPAPPSRPTAPTSEGTAPGTVSQGADGVQYPDDSRLGVVVVRLLKTNRLQEAEMVARTVAQARPDVDRAKFFWALAVQKQKRYGQAREVMEQVMDSKQAFPERGHVPYFLGWSCYYTGDISSAKHYFEIHASHWPNYDDTHYGLGVIALDEDRVADAEQFFNRALQLQQLVPDDRRSQAKTIARLGDVAMRQDRFDVALSRYESAVSLWPDTYEAWARMVRLYNRAGREADAERAAEGERKARERMGRSAQDGEGDDGGAPSGAEAPAPATQPTSEGSGATAPSATPDGGAAAPPTNTPNGTEQR